ncbi:unnamed protein product, partial [Ectocarpus sp. 12 AP-2014]
MLAVVVPGAQRVLARQAGHSQRSLGVIGRCRDCAEYPRKVPKSWLTAAAAGGEARCRANDHGPWSTRGTVRRLSLRPESSRSDNPSSTLGLGVGAILAMGGLLLATQAHDGNPAATEAEGGRGGRHGGDDFHASFASRTGIAASSDSEQHSPEETDENSTTSPPPAAPAAQPDPEPDSGGGGGGAPPNGDGGGGEEEEFPAEGRYRFYILTPEEAAAEGTSALDGFAGGWDGDEDDEGEDGDDDDRGGARLKERYHFVVIGGGTTADAAMESILRMRPEAEILCLSDETPCPADDSDTHTGSYEADFRLLKTDLAASFNQWRRHLAFREEGFANVGDGGSGRAEGGEGRSAYGLSKGKEIRYHTYE